MYSLTIKSKLSAPSIVCPRASDSSRGFNHTNTVAYALGLGTVGDQIPCSLCPTWSALCGMFGEDVVQGSRVEPRAGDMERMLVSELSLL
jgi:hypothetical protein